MNHLLPTKKNHMTGESAVVMELSILWLRSIFLAQNIKYFCPDQHQINFSWVRVSLTFAAESVPRHNLQKSEFRRHTLQKSEFRIPAVWECSRLYTVLGRLVWGEKSYLRTCSAEYTYLQPKIIKLATQRRKTPHPTCRVEWMCRQKCTWPFFLSGEARKAHGPSTWPCPRRSFTSVLTKLYTSISTILLRFYCL